MIVHKYKGNDNLIVYPLSDVHLGSAEHMADKWTDLCKTILEKPNIFVTLGGDLINNATRSSVSNIFDETMRPSEQKKIMTELLRPLAENGRILCSVSGNHEARSKKDADDDPNYDIMCKLDLEHLWRENTAFVKIQCGTRKDHRSPVYTLAVTHGAGGGIYAGASVNRAERYSYYFDGVDAVIIGHTHKPSITVPEKIVVSPNSNTVTRRPVIVVVSCAWQYYGGYALRKMLQPASPARPQILELGRKEKSITTHWQCV